MAIALFPAFLVIAGALLYALSSNPKASELGRIAYGCGLLVLSFVLANHVVKLLP